MVLARQGRVGVKNWMMSHKLKNRERVDNREKCEVGKKQRKWGGVVKSVRWFWLKWYVEISGLGYKMRGWERVWSARGVIRGRAVEVTRGGHRFVIGRSVCVRECIFVDVCGCALTGCLKRGKVEEKWDLVMLRRWVKALEENSEKDYKRMTNRRFISSWSGHVGSLEMK